MLRATIKDLWARKIRLVTTGLAVLLGIAFMSGTLVLTDTIRRTFDDLFANVFAGTDAQVRAEATLEGSFGPGGGVELRPRIGAEVVAAVAAVEGVELARGTILADGVLVVGKDGKAVGGGNGPPTFGGEWADDALNPYKLAEGRAPQANDEAVIDRGVAENGDLAVGDRTTILVPEPVEVTIVGIATFGSVDSAGGATFVGMTVGPAQLYFAEPGKFDAVGVIAEDGVSQDELKQRIRAALPGHEVLTGAELTDENQDQVKQALGFFQQILLVFAYVALFVGSFIIYNTFGIIVAQRTKELALFRALGASRRQVLRSVLVEATVVGFLASIVGLLAGIALASGLKEVLKNTVEVPAGGTVITSGTVISSIVTGVVVAVAAAWWPARRAGRVPPLAAMRDVAVDRTGTSLRRRIIGAAVLALGLLSLLSGLFGSGDRVPKVGFGVLGIFIGVSILGPVFATPVAKVLGAPLPRFRGMPGTLARENALRNPARTSSTASALMIGVALVGFITVFASSAAASINQVIGNRFAADLIIDSGSFGPGGGLAPSLVDELRALPEVENVSSVRATLATVDGDDAFIFGIDTVTMPTLFDVGVTAGSYEQLDDHSIALQQDWAEDHGFGIGDTVEVQLVEGPPEQLTVNMLYEDNVFATGYFLPRSVFERGVPDQADIQVYLTLADGVSIEDGRAAVERAAQPYPTAKVNDIAGFQEQQASQFNIILGLVYVLLLLAIVIALLGIANTLALSVFERTHEIGLLRAIGMTRAQTRSTIRWESVLIALLGTVLGLTLGLFFGWVLSIALREQGLEVFSIPYFSLFVIAVLAAVAGVIAAIWPARRAARLNVLAAIATQ